jgi:hypothetical protein
MNTILLPYHTFNASLLQRKEQIDFAHVRLNVFVKDETKLTPELYTFLNSLQNDYIVSISESLVVNAKIYLLLVLNQATKGQKVLPIFADNKYSADNLHAATLKTYLMQQGIIDIEFPVFNLALSEKQTVGNCSLMLLQNQSNYLQQDLAENSLPVCTLIIASTDAINNLITLSDLQQQLASYEESNLASVTNLKGYIEKEEFESERKLWKQRTLVYQDFLSLSKKVQEKEYYEVLDWYHKEYEILPLWYKQFGHIIKVMMGKRSFRSLFDDKVKKYKD